VVEERVRNWGVKQREKETETGLQTKSSSNEGFGIKKRGGKRARYSPQQGKMENSIQRKIGKREEYLERVNSTS